MVEIPAKPQWCELRQIVFGWTQIEFPFRVRSGRKSKLSQLPIITVIGKAFFDIGHAPADHSNRRTDLQGYAVWEIHPLVADRDRDASTRAISKSGDLLLNFLPDV